MEESMDKKKKNTYSSFKIKIEYIVLYIVFKETFPSCLNT